VDKSWSEIRALVREALLLLIVLAIVVLGLPFAPDIFWGATALRAAAIAPRAGQAPRRALPLPSCYWR